MTRKEYTHTRDLTFSGWIRENLPDSSTGLLVTDLDFIVYNWKKKKILLLEIKTRNTPLKNWQQRLFDKLSKWIAKGIDDDWTYLGFHTLKFEKTFFNDGKCYLDNKLISEKDLIEKFNKL